MVAELATVPPAEIGEQRARAIDLRAEVLWCVSEAKRLGRAAEAGEDLPTALHAVHQVRAVLELLARYARLEQGAQLASQGTSGGMLERFGSATAALAWLREEGLALLEREAAAEGAIA